ncbi:hypothetical protein C8J57DRAFT_1461239 [Mycena rebaudengoi]|nr:hypothetical protein C8J57DRAFT_1461239 [Mycena rebaudengoi]
MSSNEILSFDLSASYGALIIAAYISCALWGINIMQAYIYYWNYPDDSWPLKTLVAFLLMIDTAHKILITKVPWFTLVQNWGSVSAILASPEEALVRYETHIHSSPFLHLRQHEAWVGSIIIIVVQLYFLRRISKFASTTRHARSWWLWIAFTVLVLLSISQVPLTIAYCVFSINKVNIFIPVNLRIKRAGLIAAAVVDIAIAMGMLTLLKDTDSADKRTFRSKRTSRTLRRLTVIIINTGLATAVIAIISLILDETASGTKFWTAIAQYPQCSIYLSAFLANLNARRYIRGTGEDVVISNVEDLRFASGTTGQGDTETNNADPQIVLKHIASDVNSSGTERQETTDDHLKIEKYSHSV